MTISKEATTGSTAPLGWPAIWENMQAQHKKDPRSMTEDELKAFLQSRTMLVFSHWVGPKKSLSFPHESAEIIDDVSGILQLPHRLVLLTRPYVELNPHQAEPASSPCYYLLDFTFSDVRMSPNHHSFWWRKTETHGSYLVRFNDSTCKAAKEMGHVITQLRGRYSVIDRDYGFSVESDGKTPKLRLNLKHPPLEDPLRQKTFELLTGEEQDGKAQIIPVGDKSTSDIVRRIIELNMPVDLSRSRI